MDEINNPSGNAVNVYHDENGAYFSILIDGVLTRHNIPRKRALDLAATLIIDQIKAAK